VLILPLSDMHVDGTNYEIPSAGPASVIVIAGDIADGFHKASPWLLRVARKYHEKKVLFVLGNHCLSNLGMTIQESYEAYLELTEQCPNLHLLSSGVCGPRNEYLDEDAKVAFIGDTLWTNFSANGDPEYDMRYAQRLMIEYGWVYTNPATLLTPEVVWEMHEEMKLLLLERAAVLKAEGYKVVMAVHHGVHPLSENTNFMGKPSCAAYCSKVIPDEGNPNIDLVIHGHVHQFKEYFLGNTHVVHNPVCSGVPYPHKMTVEV